MKKFLQSSRLARTAEGREVLRSDDFNRYWFYISEHIPLPTDLQRLIAPLRPVSVSSVSYHLQMAALPIKDLFGELEDEVYQDFD